MVTSELNADNNANEPVSENQACQEKLDLSQDVLAEEILENINKTPLGQVLKTIASMPEIRKGKVLNVRSKICRGNYNLNERLSIVLDEVLEELFT